MNIPFRDNDLMYVYVHVFPDAYTCILSKYKSRTRCFSFRMVHRDRINCAEIIRLLLNHLLVMGCQLQCGSAGIVVCLMLLVIQLRVHIVNNSFRIME